MSDKRQNCVNNPSNVSFTCAFQPDGDDEPNENDVVLVREEAKGDEEEEGKEEEMAVEEREVEADERKESAGNNHQKSKRRSARAIQPSERRFKCPCLKTSGYVHHSSLHRHQQTCFDRLRAREPDHVAQAVVVAPAPSAVPINQ